MNDVLENKLSRNLAVASFLRQFESIWTASAVLGASVTELESLIDQVQAINAELAADARGFAILKSNKRADMVDFGKKVQSGVLAYAGSIGDVVLLKQVGFPESSLEKRRDTSIIEVMQLISGTASTLVAEITPYGVDQALIDDLDAKIADFELIVQKPRTVSSEYSAKNKDVVLLMKQIDLLMNGKIRYLLLPFKHTHQTFYNGYKKANMIIDLGRRKRASTTKLSGRVIDFESGVPIGGVLLEILEFNDKKMTTKADGKYSFDFEEGGIVTIKATKEDYYDTSETVELEKGVSYEMDIDMDESGADVDEEDK